VLFQPRPFYTLSSILSTMGRSSRCQRILFAAIVVMVLDSIKALSPIDCCELLPQRRQRCVFSRFVSPTVVEMTTTILILMHLTLTLIILRRRIQKVQIKVMEREIRQPPNAEFSPEQLVEEITNALLDGFLRSCARFWFLATCF
jgi:hypothetical protein